MEETGGNIDLVGKNCCLIDLSSENDSLIASDALSSTPTDYPSPETRGEPRSFELTGDLGANEVDIVALTNGQSEQMPQLLETPDPEILRKTGKCNLRKSLAWDSAFFESPGVLDAEELSSMIEGAKKGKTHLLPGIEEDISTSTESISTLLSENLTVESLEDTLFEDIRASIQKSSKASNMANSNCKAASTETDNQGNCCKLNITCFLFRHTTRGVWGQGTWGSRILRQLTEKSSFTSPFNIADASITSEADAATLIFVTNYYTSITMSIHPAVPVGSPAIPPQLMSPSHPLPVLQNGNSTSSLARLPKVVRRPGPISNITTKRAASLDVNCDKTETDNAKVGGIGTQVPKSTGLAGCRAVPKPALSSKSSSSASFGAIKEATKSSSSCDSSSSSLSNNIRESPSTSASRKPKPGLLFILLLVQSLKPHQRFHRRKNHLIILGNAEIDEIKTAGIFDSSTDNYIEYLKPSQEVGEGDELYGECHSNDGLLYMTNVKQNGCPKDLVDGLSRNMGALDIQVEMQKELTGSINSQSEVSYLDCGAPELCSEKHFLPDQKEVSVNDLLTSCTRTPFAANHSLYNIEGVDFSIGRRTVVEVKTNILTSFRDCPD